jgi:hypothetical protein
MFELVDGDIVKMAGGSRRSLVSARKQLSARGLVVYDRQPGGRYTYTLCDVVTGRPFPGDPRAKVVCEKRSPRVISSVPVTIPPVAKPVPPAIGTRPEGIDLCDIDFPFGHNLGGSGPVMDPSKYRPFDW